MGSEIKSAREIALEKVEKMGGSTEEERLKWKHGPQGEQLGVRYLKEDFDLLAELKQYPENARKYVAEGAADVLLRDIALPGSDAARKTNKKAMDGLKLLKNDKVRVENVFSQFRRLFDHYATQGEQQRKQAYQSVKGDFEDRLQETAKQQGLAVVGKLDVERQPQFQQEWRRMLAQLDSQYLTVLNEYKRELANIT